MENRNFTLIELLVVIAILGILISILLPSLSKARHVTKLAVCKSNLSQCNKGLNIYIKNNKGRFPDAKTPGKGPTQSGWIGNTKYGGIRAQLNKYLSDDDNYRVESARCPSDEVTSSGYWAFKLLGSSYCGNIWSSSSTKGLNGTYMTEVEEPVKTWSIGPQALNYFKQGVENKLPEDMRFHSALSRSKFPAVFVDGSVRIITPRNGVMVDSYFRHTWKD